MDQQIRALFPAAQNYTYLNSAAVAPMPVTAVKAIASQLEDVANSGSLNMARWHATKTRARELTASMLGVRAGQIAFMRNTSDGFCSVAAGMNWRAGDNIVTFAGEFPANYYPWRELRNNYGVEIRNCPERGGWIDIDELTSLIDGNTRLVAVSAVQYSSGFRLDLERIGRKVRKADALFAVDIIQAFGVTPLDLPEQFVDIAAGASYKWLCSPEGCGIFYLSDRALERIKPVSIGWMSVKEPWDFDQREQQQKDGCLAWETGMGGSALFYGLEQSLDLLRETGTARISAYLEDLTDFLCEILPARYEIVSSRASGQKSQIVSIRDVNGLNNMPADKIAEILLRENIVVSSRGGCVRIAPHFFNNFTDIERLVEYLP
ncbi:MAG TPA: aminotransferase class V-fold PLP-dependent enzyme [Pyrinomonadaceae bacterium]|jgi:selenocysteine lyase/cysteine desulfurase|nr:aminotransferase class V-fold PLP-dependent enzyme [Pyrinomonadaceae bacterium]